MLALTLGRTEAEAVTASRQVMGAANECVAGPVRDTGTSLGNAKTAGALDAATNASELEAGFAADQPIQP